MTLGALGLVLTALAVPGRAMAKAPSIPKAQSRYFVAGDRWWYSLEGVTSKSSVTKLKCSDKSVFDVKKVKDGKKVFVVITPKKDGKATVSFRVKYKKKTYKLRTKLTAKKYVNPLSVLKLGKMNLTRKFDATSRYALGLQRDLKKQKLYVKLKSGWKLGNIIVFDDRSRKYYDNKDKITVKKGQTINVWVEDSEGVGFNLVIW